MADDEFDVIVIGMGPGGEFLAGELAKAGLDVAGVEAGLVGGECPYFGCVPSKMMIRAGNVLAETHRVATLAGRASAEPDWAPVAARIRDEATDDWDDTVAAERFIGNGGHLFRGTGQLTGPGAVLVRAGDPGGSKVLRARRGVVIASGTEPAIPPVPGLAGTPFWTNRDAVKVTEVPGSLIVLGGGAIGVELGQVFARFGARVTVIEGMDRLLPAEEPEAGELLASVFEREGITVRTGASVRSVRWTDGFEVTLATGESLQAARLLVATGRRTDLAAVGAGSVGIDEQGRFVPTDERLRAAPGVWALGDITGHGMFTHVSMYQAKIALADLLGRPHPPADYRAVPRVTFTDPEIGSVGLSEAQARDQGLRVRVGVAQLPQSARGWIHKVGNDGLIKLVEDAASGVLAGATSAGPVGGEVLSMLTLAVHSRIPVAALRELIFAYPTFHRAVEDALAALAEPAS